MTMNGMRLSNKSKLQQIRDDVYTNYGYPSSYGNGFDQYSPPTPNFNDISLDYFSQYDQFDGLTYSRSTFTQRSIDGGDPTTDLDDTIIVDQ